MTPNQLRALVMASIHGPACASSSHWINEWDDDRRAKYLEGVRRDADLIIAAAGAELVNPLDEEVDEHAGAAACQEHTFIDVGGVFSGCVRCGAMKKPPPAHAHRLDAATRQPSPIGGPDLGGNEIRDR